MRISRDDLYIMVAHMFAKRSTCVRREVGCVLVDAQGHVLATGYNGVPAGMSHCNEGHACPGAGADSGTRLDECFATHAEQNALLQCADVSKIDTVYCTTMPCVHCLKLLRNTGTRRLVYAEGYAGTVEHLTRGWEVRYLPVEEVFERNDDFDDENAEDGIPVQDD